MHTKQDDTNQVEQKLGKYQLIERLGQGGMAQVFRAHQPTIERSVAIKVLHAHLTARDEFVARFKREARGLGQLRHPHIVSVIDFDAVDDSYYMVMDFIEGPTLADVLARRGALPVEEALLIAEQVAGALAYAHARGAIHRDVKPGNIMFLHNHADNDPAGAVVPSGAASPNALHAVLTDFGIARLLDDVGLTMSGAVAGTPFYMSPEAANGDTVDARTDIYSLGVVLYEMVTGETPYKGTTPVRVMMQHVTQPLPPLRENHPELPEPVVEIIERALAKDPAARFASAADLQQALLQARLALNNGRPPQTLLMPEQTAIAPAVSATVHIAASSPAPGADRAESQPPTPQAKPRRRVAEMIVALVLIAAVAAGWLFVADAGQTSADAATGEVMGRLRIVPAGAAQNLVLTVDAIAEPPPNQHYHAWIRATDGVLFDLGALTVTDGAIYHQSVAQHNILATLDSVLITLEGADAPAAPSEQVALRGELPPGVADALDRLLVAGDLPLGKPLLSAGVEQVTIAQEHTAMLNDSLAAGDLAEAQRHAEHVVNILDGEDGALFGDLNLDGQAQNPGDGVGVRAYLRASADALAVTALEIAPVEAAQAATEAAMRAAQQVSAADSLAEAAEPAVLIATHLHELLNGSDQDGSGAVETDRGEGAFLATIESVDALSSVSLRRTADSVSLEETDRLTR